MKKFLLLAAMGLLVTSSAFAVEFPNPNGVNSCTACGDESETSTDITVCAGVRVPLCVLVEDATLTFPCLRRPLTSYATHHTDGWASQWTIDPASATQQTAGNTAKIRIQGDADDEVMMQFVQGGNVLGNKINLQHVNTAGQYSAGPHQIVPGGPLTYEAGYNAGNTSNPDYLTVTLSASVSQYNNGTTTTNGDVVDANTLDAPVPAGTTPYGGITYGAAGEIWGPNTTVAKSFTLNHNDGSGFLGTGGLHIWFGGSVATQAGQQRGTYMSTFKVKFSYAQ
jgi:hypothetical protein